MGRKHRYEEDDRPSAEDVMRMLGYTDDNGEILNINPDSDIFDGNDDWD